MSESRFTAQEMREVAEGLVDSCVADNISILVGHGNLKAVKGDRIVAMLRQAADAEDELAKAKRPDACPANPTNKMCYLPGEYCCDAVRYLQNENARLRARLAAVVMECEVEKSKWIPAMEYETIVKRSSMVDRYDRILRAARGEEGAK